MVDVFISYPRAARGKVEPIKAKLDALGLDCFFDVENIDGGANFPDIIDRALRSSRAVLCCWSPLYFERPRCMIECRDGLAREIMVPVALEPFERFAPPADLRHVNYLNLTDWSGADAHEDWNRTLHALAKLVERELAPPLKKTLFRNEADGTAPAAPEMAQARARMAAEAEARRTEEEENLARESALRQWFEQDRARYPARIKTGTVWRDAFRSLAEALCPEMVTIPPGRFLMGSPASENGRLDSEGPQHEVQIGYAFAMGKFTVTFEQWDGAIAAGAPLRPIATGAKGWVSSDQGWGRGNRPVIGVTWRDAQDYIAWLNERLRSCGDAPYRLPSEAEWEYACRSGTKTPFHFGTTISPTQANFGGEARQRSGKQSFRGKTTPVGSYPANAFGLHDMHGNVYEWCEDGWSENYDGAPNDGTAQLTELGPVVRGGSFYDEGQCLRSAYRTWPPPPMLVSEIGIRVARML